MTPGENINEFSEEVAKRLNEVQQNIKNLIDDSRVSAETTWSSQKFRDSQKDDYIDKYDYTTGDSQIFPLKIENPRIIGISVNGQGISESQYNPNRDNIEILDQLSNRDYIIIHYEKQ